MRKLKIFIVLALIAIALMLTACPVSSSVSGSDSSSSSGDASASDSSSSSESTSTTDTSGTDNTSASESSSDSDSSSGSDSSSDSGSSSGSDSSSSSDSSTEETDPVVILKTCYNLIIAAIEDNTGTLVPTGEEKTYTDGHGCTFASSGYSWSITFKNHDYDGNGHNINGEISFTSGSGTYNVNSCDIKNITMSYNGQQVSFNFYLAYIVKSSSGDILKYNDGAYGSYSIGDIDYPLTEAQVKDIVTSVFIYI